MKTVVTIRKLVRELSRGALVLLLFSLLTACQPIVLPGVQQSTLMEEDQKTREISTAELRQILTGKSAVVFDARPHLEYSISHIAGALNVAPKPGVEMSQYVSDVAEIERIVPDKQAAIVLYCNGPFCGKSKRLSEELLDAGFTNVRRYQLGIPTWRALVGLTQIELDGARYVAQGDKTAVWVDARSQAEFATGTLPSAVNMVDKEDVAKAKDDKRLPMHDHNTRIIVFGNNGEQARTVAAEIAKNAFHNVSYFDGAAEDLFQGFSTMSPARRVYGDTQSIVRVCKPRAPCMD